VSEITHPARVLHFPQVPCKPFVAPAPNVEAAVQLAEALALQHLWLFENRIIPDYSNVISVEVWDGEEWEEVDEDNPVYADFQLKYAALTKRVYDLSPEVES